MRSKVGRYTYDTERALMVYEADRGDMAFEVYRRERDGRMFVVFTDGQGETLLVPEYKKMRLIEDALERTDGVPIGFHWFARLFEQETQRR